MTQLAIHGAAGRMGQRLVALAAEDPALKLTAAIEHPDHPRLGVDAGELAGAGQLNVPLTRELEAPAEVMIDFTNAEGMRRALELCQPKGMALVIGSTGFSADDEQAIDQAAKTLAILQAPNMSLGVNLLFALAGQVAKRLGEDYDIEIVEAHHRFKQDAPSGTALGLARSICEATGKDLDQTLTHGRSGAQPRQSGEIGMHALRLGDEVGRHSAHFATLGEELTLAHKANTRDVFVRGALAAAKWLVQQNPGRYAMKDMLALD
jgi:4-hydroxy-tetrahydrodipicolinate reductase